MIVALRSARTSWKRYLKFVALAALIVVAAFMILTKELHHSSATAPPPPQSPAVVAQVHATKHATPATTITGGIPLSKRNPFQG